VPQRLAPPAQVQLASLSAQLDGVRRTADAAREARRRLGLAEGAAPEPSAVLRQAQLLHVALGLGEGEGEEGVDQAVGREVMALLNSLAKCAGGACAGAEPAPAAGGGDDK
jgi:hypothetical protein